MRSPFPGMDPYLEHPALWPDVHNRLIAAIADELTPLVAPRYYIGLERRAYLLKPDDVAVIAPRPTAGPKARLPLADAGVLEVEVPVADQVSEAYLEIHDVSTGKLVTLMELLSPANKLYDDGREQYLQKRAQVMLTATNLVEIDLLRAGKPMPLVGAEVGSDYRILVSRGWQRPRALLYYFGLRQPLPVFLLPLMPDDQEPAVDLGAILHALYERARFDLRLDYSQPPVPPLSDEDMAWKDGLFGEAS